MENDKELKQAKKRTEKIYITDIAIQKVPYIRYKNFSEKQNMIMRQLARDVLSLSKEFNDSNEVAITCDIGADMPLDEYGISYGTEHSVQITSDTLSNHILTSADSVSVVILHNHPSSQTFSLEDIRFFLVYSTVAVISVVSNQGTIHYLYKDKKYDFVLSSNNLEHIANPLKALKEFSRIVKPDGTILVLVPEKTETFDHNRDYTTFEHLLEDYKSDTGEDDLSHLPDIIEKHDYSLDPECGGKQKFIERAKKNLENRCLHHHVFEEETLRKSYKFAGIKVTHVKRIMGNWRIYVFSLFILRWLLFPWCQIRERFITCIKISNMIFIKHLLCLRNLPQKQLKILQ